MNAPSSTIGFLLTILLLAVVPVVAPTQIPSPPEIGSGQEPIFRMETDLVVLHATVHNHKGVLVSGLERDRFQVFENGALQQIKHFSYEDVPVTVGLVIDNSGSMGPKRLQVITAALAFARSSNPLDQMFVVNFNEHVSFGLPDTMPFTDGVPQLERALANVTANGETALYDAIALSLQHVTRGNSEKKVLIVISDGGDNASKHDLAQIVSMARLPGAIIYTIGLFDPTDEDRNPKVLKQLAHETGGETFLPKSVKELVPICERIARDIRTQYTIAYAPANRTQDGSYRAIRVSAIGANGEILEVRTRPGYLAKSPKLPSLPKENRP